MGEALGSPTPVYEPVTYIDGTEVLSKLVGRREQLSVCLQHLGQIITDQPEARMRWIPGEHNHSLASHAAQLPEPGTAVPPVMDGQHR